MEPKRVLLVEDDPRDLELTITALRENNLANEVLAVRDGEEALDFLYRQGKYKTLDPGNPAVVLLDLKLPKTDGIEVLREIRSNPDTKETPVVVLTSSHEESDLIESYKLGVNAYVVKPVHFNEFVDAIKKIGLFWLIINEPPPGSIQNKSNH